MPFEKSLAKAEALSKLATDTEAIVWSPILRYQAWALAYFDAKEFRRAAFFENDLQQQDPLSPYSQFERMQDLFRTPKRNYTGEELMQF